MSNKASRAVRPVRFIATATAASVIGLSAFAQDVVLSARDGSADMSGVLVAYEGGIYTLRTVVGDMQFSYSEVTCEGDACPKAATAEVDMVISGSDTIGDELMPLLLTGYAASQGAGIELEPGAAPEQRVASLVADEGFGDTMMSAMIKAEGSSSAFRELLSRDAMIGMASRRIRREEARDLKENGAGVMVSPTQEHVVAVDALRVVVSPQNPIGALSVQQLAAIFSGAVTNWSEVGGADQPITVYSRDESSGTRGVFDDRILETQNAALRGDAVIVTGNSEMTASVAENPGGIGYTGFAYGQGTKSIDVVTECGIRTQPTAFGAKTESYPLQRRLYLYTRADNLSDDATDFLEFASSEGADGLIGKAGFIDLGVERVPQDDAVARVEDQLFEATDLYVVEGLETLQDQMRQWDRLSTTFRFTSGSTELSTKARNDLDRMISYLERQGRGMRVAVVGFTDNEGPFQSNVDLSSERADDVLAQIRDAAGSRLDHVEFSSMGFGPMSPSACNDTASGKAINRRVEVWVR